MIPMEIIARIRSDFPTKFGIPRQSGLVEELRARVVFEPEYRNPDALRGLEDFSHIWLIWQFSQAVREGWSPTVRPPRLGGNTRMGVFATRSPFRPNPVGLSCVRLLGIERDPELGHVLVVAGAEPAEEAEISLEDGVRLVLARRAAGERMKDAVRQVAADTGLNRNELYAAALAAGGPGA